MATKWESFETEPTFELPFDSTWYAQTFSHISSTTQRYTIPFVKLLLKRTGSFSGTIVVSLRETSNGVPVGQDLCIGYSDGSTLSSDPEWRIISFGNPVTLESNKTYALIVRISTSASVIKIYGAEGYTNGNSFYSSDNGQTWNARPSSEDFLFQIWGYEVTQGENLIGDSDTSLPAYYDHWLAQTFTINSSQTISSVRLLVSVYNGNVSYCYVSIRECNEQGLPMGSDLTVGKVSMTDVSEGTKVWKEVHLLPCKLTVPSGENKKYAIIVHIAERIPSLAWFTANENAYLGGAACISSDFGQTWYEYPEPLDFFFEVFFNSEEKSEYVEVNNPDEEPLYAYNETWVAQTFTIGAVGQNRPFRVNRILLPFWNWYSNLADVEVSIRATDAEGKPTGPDLAYGRIYNTYFENYDWRDIFVENFILNPSTRYAIVVRIRNGMVSWSLEPDVYLLGQPAFSEDSGQTWHLFYPYNDAHFQIWGNFIEEEKEKNHQIDLLLLKSIRRTYSADMILIKEDPYKLIYTYEHETKEKDYGKNLRFEKWIKKNFTLKNLGFGWHLKYPSYYNKQMSAADSGWIFPAIESFAQSISLRGYEARIIDGSNCGIYGTRNKGMPDTRGSIANIIWIDPPITLNADETLTFFFDKKNSSNVHILRAAAITSSSGGERKISDLKEIKFFNSTGQEKKALLSGNFTLKTLIWGSEELYDRFNPIRPVETNSTSITIEDQEGTVVQDFFNSKFVTSNVCGTIASQYGKSLGAFVLPEDFLDLYFQASNSNPLKFVWEVRNLSEYPAVYNLYLIGSYKTIVQKTYSADILLRKPIKREFLIDIYLYLRRKQFQIDAWILKKPFLLFDTDMILRKSPFAAYPIDSMLVKARHKSFDIDSLLMLSKIKEIYSDMILKALPALDYYADTILTLWHRKDYNVDSAVLKRIEKELKSDLIILTRQIKEFSQDLLLKKSFGLSFLADMITKKAEKLVYNIDSLLKKGFSKDFETDMLLKESFVLIFQIDAILKKLISKEYETDIALKKALETNYWTDTLVKASLLIDYLNDAIVVLSKKKDYQIDLRLLKKSLKDFENDIILLKSLTRDFRIDLFLTGKSQRFYSIDALIKASKTKNFLSDLILVLSGLKGYFADLILTSPFRREMNIDSILKKSLIRGFSIDTILRGMYERSYLSDALLIRTKYNDYLTDVLLSKGKASPFFIDALIKSSIRKIFNIDLRLVRAVRKDFYSDIALKRAYSKGYAIDTFLYASLKQYYVDMILAKMFPREKIIKYSAELITPKKDYISHVEIPAEEGEVTKIKKKESETY